MAGRAPAGQCIRAPHTNHLLRFLQFYVSLMAVGVLATNRRLFKSLEVSVCYRAGRWQRVDVVSSAPVAVHANALFEAALSRPVFDSGQCQPGTQSDAIADKFALTHGIWIVRLPPASLHCSRSGLPASPAPRPGCHALASHQSVCHPSPGGLTIPGSIAASRRHARRSRQPDCRDRRARP